MKNFFDKEIPKYEITLNVIVSKKIKKHYLTNEALASYFKLINSEELEIKFKEILIAIFDDYCRYINKDLKFTNYQDFLYYYYYDSIKITFLNIQN